VSAKGRAHKQVRSETVAAPMPPLAVIVRVAAVAIALQALVWTLLYETFGVAKLGYSFFELSDIAYYYDMYVVRIAAGLAPFRDFFIEYPPLFAPLLVVPGTHIAEPAYAARFAFLMAAFLAAACAVTALAAWTERTPSRPYLVAVVFSACTLLLGPIAANRYDATVALVLAFVLLFIARGRWTAAATVIGVGFALKITPAMLLPLVLILAPRERGARMLVGFAIAAVLPFAWVMLMGQGASDNLAKMIAYHANRPLEIESVLATPFWIGRLAGITTVKVGLAAGSQVVVARAADLLAKASSVVLLASLGAVFGLVWRRKNEFASDTSLQFLAVLATLLASLVGSKVLSPQYFVWILPAVALVAVERRVLGGLLGAVLLLTHIEFPANYWAFAQYQTPGAISIVVVRNLILVAAFALALWQMWTVPEAAAAKKRR
jgi:hypothetical protein